MEDPCGMTTKGKASKPQKDLMPVGSGLFSCLFLFYQIWRDQTYVNYFAFWK